MYCIQRCDFFFLAILMCLGAGVWGGRQIPDKRLIIAAIRNYDPTVVDNPRFIPALARNCSFDFLPLFTDFADHWLWYERRDVGQWLPRILTPIDSNWNLVEVATLSLAEI